MFPKYVLRQFKRGQRPGQALHFTKALLMRWRVGERAGLWHEAAESQRVTRARDNKDANGERGKIVKLNV